MDLETASAVCKRSPGESARAFAACSLYLDLGPGRSYQRVAQELSVSLTLIKRWGARWSWQERSAAWDEHLAEKKREAQVAAVEGMAERQAGLGLMAQNVAAQKLSALTDDEIRNMTFGQLCQLLKVGTSVERTARGQPDQIIKAQSVNHNVNETTHTVVKVVETIVRTKADLRQALANPLGEPLMVDDH